MFVYIVHYDIRSGGHKANVIHGLHVPDHLGADWLGNSATALTLCTSGGRHQDCQQRNDQAHQGTLAVHSSAIFLY